MDNSLIEQGFNLMLFGMGTVFIFLTLLIFATSTMSKVIARFFPDKIITPPAPKKKAPLAAATVGPMTLKIIQGAINQHRKR